MASITITASPQPLVLQRLPHSQVGYALLHIAAVPQAPCPVNWAVVVDASRSMRVPMVDEAQFRVLAQRSSMHEALVDGVPVWQLGAAVPPDMRASIRSPLDHATAALHAVAEQLGSNDRCALLACATTTPVLLESTSGTDQAALHSGIEQLPHTQHAEHSGLAGGLQAALHELRRGRAGCRTERLLLLSDGFTDDATACRDILARAASEGTTISIVGFGGECNTDVIHSLAACCGGRVIIVEHPDAIQAALEHELRADRNVAARAAELRQWAAPGVCLRRASRIAPAPALFDPHAPLPLGELSGNAPLDVLLEYLVEPEANGLAQIELTAGGATIRHTLDLRWSLAPPALLPAVAQAAARATSMRLEARAAATHAGAHGQTEQQIATNMRLNQAYS